MSRQEKLLQQSSLLLRGKLVEIVLCVIAHHPKYLKCAHIERRKKNVNLLNREICMHRFKIKSESFHP